MTENTRDQVVKALYSRFEDLQSVFVRNFNSSNYRYCDYLIPVVAQVVQAIYEITGHYPLFLSDEFFLRVDRYIHPEKYCEALCVTTL